MFIRVVDEALERFLRAEVPLPDDVADVSFEVPGTQWSGGLSRVTLNLFLFNVTRSSRPNRAAVRRVDENGRGERLAPQPMIELDYLISAWAGSPRDEHQLLGDVVSRTAALDVLPPQYVSRPLSSSVQLSFVEDERHRARDIWTGAGGVLKAAFTMQVTVAADTFDWTEEATAVSGIQGAARRKPVPEHA